MSEMVQIQVNGEWVEVHAGIGLASALYSLDHFSFRKSARGDPRGALCAMGICFECQVTIDQRTNRRSCMTVVRNGMVVETT